MMEKQRALTFSCLFYFLEILSHFPCGYRSILRGLNISYYPLLLLLLLLLNLCTGLISRIAHYYYYYINQSMQGFNFSYYPLLLLYDMDVSCHRLFLPGTSLEPAVIPTAQASSFTLQYFPYYV